MIIPYTHKINQDINTVKVKGTCTIYIVEEKYIYQYENFIQTSDALEKKIVRIVLARDNLYDLLIDNTKEKFIVAGKGMTGDYMFAQYIITEGKDEFLEQLLKHI